MWILHLSKGLMYNFHYDYIENKFGSNSKLLSTDTDSLMYEIKTKNIFKDFSKDKMVSLLNNSLDCWIQSCIHSH